MRYEHGGIYDLSTLHLDMMVRKQTRKSLTDTQRLLNKEHVIEARCGVFDLRSLKKCIDIDVFEEVKRNRPDFFFEMKEILLKFFRSEENSICHFF